VILRRVALALLLACWPRAALAQEDAPKPPTPPPPTPPPEQVEEVTVHGVKSEPGRQEMTSGEVKQLPGAFGDAFRAIEAMPGVTPIVSGLPYFLVRGAPPGNTGFFIDGVRVPALFHLGVGAAVVHPGLIDRVDFYPGGYPARFGRYTGGILSGELVPPTEHTHAEASVRLLDAGGLVDVPFADGRGEVEASGRYGYPGPLLSLFAPNVGLQYWDYQTRARWRLDDRNEIGAFIFGSYDDLTSLDSNTGKWIELLGIQFHRVDLRWDHKTGDTGHLRVALTLGYDRSEAGSQSSSSNTVNGPSGPVLQSVDTSTQYAIESETVGLRSEWMDALNPEIDARIGSDIVVEPYDVVAPGAGPLGTNNAASALGSSASNFTQVDVNGGVYGELDWRPTPSVDLRPGLRLDAFTSRSPTGTSLLGGDSGTGRAVGGVDPRLAARWEMTSWLAWITALGVAHQASNIPLPSPGLQFAQLARGLQSTFQYSAGAELQLPLKFTATIDAFLQDYTGIADLYETCPPGETSCTFNGRGVGMELMVRRKLTERFTGWLSYTLSSTTRDSYWNGHWISRLSEFDRPHVVNLVLAADLGKRWRAGARLMAYSGLPYSTTTGIEGPPNAREPPFVRLDLRLEKKWQALGGTLTLVFEWLNSLLSQEAFGTTCSAPQGQQLCQPQEIGPITFPSIGVEEVW
jgi:hypothetical protein